MSYCRTDLPSYFCPAEGANGEDSVLNNAATILELVVEVQTVDSMVLFYCIAYSYGEIIYYMKFTLLSLPHI